MKKIRYYAHLDTGDDEGFLEFPDNFPEEKIDEIAKEVALNNLDWGWHYID